MENKHKKSPEVINFNCSNYYRKDLYTDLQQRNARLVEIVEGYNDGRNNAPEPKGNRSVSYWHGWRNGMADAGHMPVDDAMRDLAHDYLK